MENKRNQKNGAAFSFDVSDYAAFVAGNQKKVNLLLNRFLRFAILIGPLMMLAIRFGIFHSVSYSTCIMVSCLVISLSSIHYYLIRQEGTTLRAAVIAFFAMDVLLVLMNSAHIGIYITWFVVPLVSLLFCDFKIYGFAVVINYCMMTLSVWLVSPYYADLRVDYEKGIQYFLERMGGFTIETVIMVLAGYSLCRISTSYYRDLIDKYQILKENREQIHEQMAKEEHLIRISMTDELTNLFNRRSFYQDTQTYREKGLEDGLVIFSADLNGLKEVNDTKGHAAGDEILTAAAECLRQVIDPIGKVYRTGGDEFLAIGKTASPAEVADEIRKRSQEWHGKLVDRLSLSVGYAAHSDHPDAGIDELQVLADQMMYEEKDRYYSIPGNDRRWHHKTGAH